MSALDNDLQAALNRIQTFSSASKQEAPALRWLKRHGMAAGFTILYFGLLLGSVTLRGLLGISGEASVQLFQVMAIFGTVMFSLRATMLLVGFSSEDTDGDFESEAGDVLVDDSADDADFDADTDAEDSDAEEGDESSEAFRLMSVQTLSTFTMGAGWIGLAATTEWSFPLWAATSVAYGFGLGMVYLMSGLLRQTKRLHCSGTINLQKAVALTARVYSRIPAKRIGCGQIEIELNGALRVMTAVTDHDEELKSFTTVLVVDNTADGHLVVLPQE